LGIIIPTDELHHFSEGLKWYHQPGQKRPGVPSLPGTEEKGALLGLAIFAMKTWLEAATKTWELYGNIWEYLEIYGNYMGIYGNIWELYGNIWE